MDIDPHIATTIVENIKGVIRHDINFFSTDGRIIASTDPTRVGTDHEAARLAAAERRIIAVDADHPFAGARDGINVPVTLGDAVIAVIGITGDRPRVEPFGNVIRKMTEILVRENLEQVSRFDRRLMMTNLTNLLVSPQPDTALIGYLATTLGIDLTQPRLVAVGRPRAGSDGTGARGGATQDGTYDAVDQLLGAHAQHLFAIYGGEYRLLLDVGGDGRDGGTVDAGARGDATALAARLGETITRLTGRTVDFGIGDTAWTQADCRRAYEQARTAALWASFTRGDDTHAPLDYGDTGLGMVLCDVDPQTARRFVDRTFAGLSESEIDEAGRLFDAHTRRNGAIGRIADDLFLHKNTVQNRLNAIARRTGYNPRDLADHTALATAFTLRRLLAFRGGEGPSVGR